MDTIEIVGGVHAGTKRLQLKSVLERYGEIDICHKDRRCLDHVGLRSIKQLTKLEGARIRKGQFNSKLAAHCLRLIYES